MNSFACLWGGVEVVAMLTSLGTWSAPLGLQDALETQFGPNFKVLDLDGNNPTERLASTEERFAAACARLGGTPMEQAVVNNSEGEV